MLSPHDIITAVPLSFQPDGSIDMDGCREILEYVARSGVQGALVLGTTGEFPALSIAERNAIAALSVELLAGLRVVVHVGAASSYEVLQLIDGARSAGAREIAILTPFYLPASSEATLEFFRTVSEASAGLEVYAYLFEARTGIRVDDALLAQIAALPHIVGVKLSGESLERVTALRAVLPAGFRIYTGSDGDFALAGAAGADGVISGVASALAKPFVAMRDALIAGDAEKVHALEAEVREAVSAIDGDASRMRAVHRIAGSPVGGARMPLPEPDADMLRILEDAARRLH